MSHNLVAIFLSSWHAEEKKKDVYILKVLLNMLYIFFMHVVLKDLLNRNLDLTTHL